MGKRLVVCLDGTWNKPQDNIRSTNVVKIMRAICPTGGNGTKQITFYDKGVGTGDPLDKFQGGAFGRGLDDNVKDGYRFLGNNYEKEDEIYIFGFSRGAYTARSLAGLIGVCGLLGKTTMGELDRAWDFYRTDKRKRQEEERKRIHDAADTDIGIKCIGVWDTVGALGIPLQSLNWLTHRKHKFHDTNLGAIVDCAFHALAIDEKRLSFAPTLWEAAEPVENQIVEQVWFPGVHSNVGGGYDSASLSDLALEWMINRVSAATNLEFDTNFIEDNFDGDALDKMHESRRGVFRFLARQWPYERVIGGQDGWVRRFIARHNKPKPGHRFINEMIHQSALDRFGKSVPLKDGNHETKAVYEPDNVGAARGKLPVVGYDGKTM